MREFVLATACVALVGCAFADGGGSTSDPDATAYVWPDAGGLTSADAGWSTSDGGPNSSADAATLEGRNGYPGDFPELTDSGGFGAGEIIAGFGGDDTTDRNGNRAQLVRRPVVLIHGNGTTATNDTFGMIHVRDMLNAAGYVDAEIWALSYLGQSVSIAETPTPHRTNIDDVRSFIDAVLDYTGAPAVDVISHSLGCGMINGYVRGMTTTGSFDDADNRMDKVSTVVCLGGAVYGTGYGFLYAPEFDVGGTFTSASLTWAGVEDATPYGASNEADMIAPATGLIPGAKPFKLSTSVDDNSRRIYWVALWATGDVVDGNLAGGCALQGADINQGFELPTTLPGTLTAAMARHGHLLRNQGVFDTLLPYLNR